MLYVRTLVPSNSTPSNVLEASCEMGLIYGSEIVSSICVPVHFFLVSASPLLISRQSHLFCNRWVGCTP
jgi:hypothetical protein